MTSRRGREEGDHDTTRSKATGFSLFLCLAGQAQSGGQFAIVKSVVAGGGTQSSGGTFIVTGTPGQAAAGVGSVVPPLRS